MIAQNQTLFAPMHWPMLDDGKKPGTNALGYATGNWYAEQRKKIEDEERARLEAIEKERARRRLLRKSVKDSASLL